VSLNNPYDVRIMGIGGTVEMVNLSSFVTGVRWNRPLDSWDEAVVQIGPVSAECCAKMMYVRPWMHELWIRLGGETVFVGPIIRPVPAAGVGAVNARGLAYWFDVRFVRDAYNTTGAPAPISAAVTHIITSALTVSDPNMLDFITVDACATNNEREIDPNTFPIAWSDQLQQIIGTYMHMSSLGRELKFWCISDCIGFLPDLPATDLLNDVPFTFDGDEFTTHAAVSNGLSTGTFAGEAGGIDATYNLLVERKFIDASITSDATGALAAANKLTRDAPLRVGDTKDLRMELTSGCTTWIPSRVQAGMCGLVEFRGCGRIVRPVMVTTVGGEWSAGSDQISDKIYVAVQERVIV